MADPETSSRRHSFLATLRKRWRRPVQIEVVSPDQPEAVEATDPNDPRSLFDAAWYLATYKDIAGSNIDPFDHFVRHGEAEGRDPSATFSTTFYRATYMVDETLNTSPTQHYLRSGRALGYDPSPSPVDKYALRVFAQEQSYGLEIPELCHHIQVMTVRPRFLVFVERSGARTRTQIENGLQRQIYRDWQICSSIDDIPDVLSEGDDPWFLVWLDSNDTLHSSALYCFASALNADPDLDLIYSDEDLLTEAGHRADPFYKPDWSPNYLEACNYIGTGACVRGTIAAAVLEESSSDAYDFILRVTEHTERVAHIRRILLHRGRALDAPKPLSQITAEIAALDGRLARTGRNGTVTALKPNVGCYDVKIERTATPLISIVIPTAGRVVEVGGRTIDLIMNCLECVQTRSSYKNLEYVVVDNGDIDETRLAALRAMGVRSLTFDQPAINVAQKLNIGAAASHGEFLLLLNDDVEPLTPDWIERLLEHFEKPHVGVVGAKLLYPDMTIQHVGVILNGGNPDHPRLCFPRDDPGYKFSTCAARDFLAVTGAVMLVRAALFREVGGYTEALAIAFNDVDFCLKLRERGARAVYAPAAELMHHESLSRSRTVDQAELDYFHARWAHIATDPFYNEEDLTLAPATYEIHWNGRPLG